MASFMINKKRAFTMLELIITVTLSAILLLGATYILFSHAKFSTNLQSGMTQTQELAAVTESMASNIRNSHHVQIGENSLTLFGPAAGTYTWSGNNLLFNGQLVSDKLNTLTITEARVVDSKTRAVRINVSVKDPRYPDMVKSVVTTAFCRITAEGSLVRVVTAGGTEVGIYSTIQDGVNAASDGNTVQVAFNNKTPYTESVVMGSKKITLRGTYDNTTWQSHLGNPAFETVLTGSSPVGLITINNTVVGGNIRIEGFTIKDNPTGPAIAVASPVGAIGTSINIEKNIIAGNNNSGGTLPTAVVVSNYAATNISVVGNSVINNLGGTGGIGLLDPSRQGSAQTWILNNTISGNTNSGIWYETISNGYTAVFIHNNDIVNNVTGAKGGGIYAKLNAPSYDNTSVGVLINRNLIKGNRAANGGGIYIEHHGRTTPNTLSDYSSQHFIEYNIIEENSLSDLTGLGNAIYISAELWGAMGFIDNNTIRNNGFFAGNPSGQAVVYIDLHTTCPGVSEFENNLITNNFSGQPLHFFSTGTETMYSNKITNNSGSNYSSAVYLGTEQQGVFKDIMNNLIADNTNTVGGISGLDLYYGSSPIVSKFVIRYNTIAKNSGALSGGIHFQCPTANSTKIANITYAISYFNTPSNYNLTTNPSNVTITYSDGYSSSGKGNLLATDPLFTADYHTQDSTLLSGKYGCYNLVDTGRLGPEPTLALGPQPLGADQPLSKYREDVIGTYPY
ncbi:MAG: prepilin-type N-terminal cleavage/methylation domain-containing protein [Candidatus Omnitrophota bacterium]|nr:prepilin-type N-terminal cleavage/methylation domain-containing protein [Candidatus Omnitrophota bacterium]